MTAKVGDIIRFLNSTGGGKVLRIQGQIAYVDDDGFETPVLLKECVVVAKADDFKNPADNIVKTPSQTVAPKKETTDKTVELPFIETQAGEKLNIVLGFEPRDIKRLSSGEIDAYLVNDSNYYLYFTLLTGEKMSAMKCRYAGVVEPGIQVLCAELDRADLPYLERVVVQYIAFKKDSDFEPKPVGNVEIEIDNTKFVKLHCFKKNLYFDSPVIAYDITKDDVPVNHSREFVNDVVSLNTITQRQRVVKQPLKRHTEILTDKNHQSRSAEIVFDLHASELLGNTRGLSPADILNYQIDKFREVMDQNLKNYGKRIIFIHGKGDGVLRNSIIKELNYRYKGHDVQDASFREYGYGATQVTIRQHPRK